MKAEQLRGYLLEEALAYLIRSSGYKLITNPGGDLNLRVKGSGLQIRGRGGWHQADTLGRLEAIPAFTFPMRLFVEAKYHSSNPIGVNIVRNAVGTIFDLNSSAVAFDKGVPISFNYHYQYALFSATGFNNEAVELALAHGISLIDLGSIEYQELLNVIDSTATRLTERYSTENLLRSIRTALRTRLETLSSDLGLYNSSRHEDHEAIHGELDELVRVIHDYHKLYIATVNAPFMLLLKADDPTRFENYSLLQEGHDHQVEIHWDRREENGKKWTINPESNPGAYQLSFKIPEALYRWIFTKEAAQLDRAKAVKQRYMSELNIYLHNASVDKVLKLKLSERFVESLL